MDDHSELRRVAMAVRDSRDGSDDYYAALANYGMAMAPAVTLALLDEIDQLKADLADADRRAGEAERTKQDLVDYKRSTERWLEQAKLDEGFHRNDPFDKAWSGVREQRDIYKALVEALRPDAERLRFVLKSVMPISGESDGIFISKHDGPFSEVLEGDEAIKAIDLARSAPVFVYRCHKCQALTPPPVPFSMSVKCKCGALTAATAALALGGRHDA